MVPGVRQSRMGSEGTKTEGKGRDVRAGGKPATHLEKSLAMAWSQALGRTVDLDTNFYDAGGSSMDGLYIMGRVKELLGQEPPLSLLVQYPTVRQLAEGLRNLGGNLRWTNLVEVRPEGKRTPVVCVHGDEANYHLSRQLPVEHPFLAFFHQGEDGAALLHRSFPAMAAHYAKELCEARPEGPLVIGGYSYGGAIALEMAQRLRDMGREVPLLVLLDSRSPAVFRRTSIKGLLLGLRDMRDRRRCARWSGQGLPIPEHLRNFHILDVYNAAMRQWRPRPWEGASLLVRSEARAKVPHGWGVLLPRLRTVTVPGDHRSIITAEGLVPVVEEWERTMAGSSL
jgi:thioesterase domain-containing protein/acyl carrier protein